MEIEDKDVKQKKLCYFFPPLIECGDDQIFL